MKKLLLLSIFLITASSASIAQSTYIKLTPEAEKKCTELTRTMSNSLQLNEPEYIKLKALNRELFAKSAEILVAYENDKATCERKLQELKVDFDKDLKSFLTPMQLYSYSQYKEGKLSFIAASEEL